MIDHTGAPARRADVEVRASYPTVVRDGEAMRKQLLVKPRARATFHRMTLPAPLPEVPAANVDKAAAY